MPVHSRTVSVVFKVGVWRHPFVSNVRPPRYKSSGSEGKIVDALSELSCH